MNEIIINEIIKLNKIIRLMDLIQQLLICQIILMGGVCGILVALVLWPN